MKLLPLIFIFTLFSSVSCTDNSSATTGTENPTYTDEELMTQVQQDAFKYFWDWANPNSKLARERYLVENPSFEANIVTTGGSGFGLATVLVGVERGFIPREEAVKRLNTMMDFLAKADRFHGAWSHWIHGETGKVDEILIFSTRLITATNQVIYIPNGILSNGKIKNYSQLGIRRADLVLKTNYDSNFSQIKTSILNFSSSHDLVLQDPKPEILVTDLSETTIVFTVKVWANNNDYPKVTSDILEFSKSEISL